MAVVYSFNLNLFLIPWVLRSVRRQYSLLRYPYYKPAEEHIYVGNMHFMVILLHLSTDSVFLLEVYRCNSSGQYCGCRRLDFYLSTDTCGGWL